MNTNYTDEQIQKAIDAAFPQAGLTRYNNIETRPGSNYWLQEAPNRLAIARAFLAALPDRPQAAEIAALKAALAESEKQFQAKVDEIALLLDERDKAQGILKSCLSVMPFGNIETHTVENLPGRIADLASEIASLSLENERLEAELAALRQSIQSDDGISLGQVAFDGAKWAHNWEASTIKDKWQRAAQAVASVVLAQAVRRMEAVPKVELRCFYNGGRTIPEGLEFVRARLIAACLTPTQSAN